MAWYPDAIRKPVERYRPGGSSHRSMSHPGRLCYHTAVSSGDSLFALFNTPGNAVAHFYIRENGKIEQYVDTDTQASANLEGNHDTISVESWDAGGNRQTWTDAQVRTCADLAAWVHKVHGIPLERCDASPGSRGVTWHRKGIDGNFPSGLLSGRKAGDEHWSSSAGKICLPTDNTEVLTARGWVPLADVQANDAVASWSMDSGVVMFAPAVHVEPFHAQVVDIGGFESTADHEWITRRVVDVCCSCGYRGTPRGVRNHAGKGTWRGEDHHVIRTEAWKKVAAEDLRDGDVLPTAVDAAMPGIPLTLDEIRLLVWIQGDGHYMTDQTGVEWHLSKQRKIDRLATLLDYMGIPHSHRGRSDGTTCIRVFGDVARDRIIRLLPSKRFTADLLAMSPAQARVFLAELIHVDGSEELGCYFSMDGQNADVVQAVATLNGRVTSHRVDKVGLHWVRFLMRPRRARVAAEGRTTEVACLTTVDGTLIIRQNGKVAVTGNCPFDGKIRGVVNDIIPLARSIVEGDWFDMATKAELREVVDSAFAAFRNEIRTTVDNALADARPGLVQQVKHELWFNTDVYPKDDSRNVPLRLALKQLLDAHKEESG